MGNIVALAQTSFNAGEMSPYLDGRVDLAKYGNGCSLMSNFRPIPQGPALRRSGTRFVAQTKSMTDRSWLGKFIFSEDDSYVLEFGDHYVRFYTDNGQLNLGGPLLAWSNATNYVQGSLVSQGGVNYYAIQPSLNQMPPNATYWWPLTGTIYEAWSPYSIADLTNPKDGTFVLDFEQTGDTIFIFHPSFFPQKLTRFDTTFWTIAPANITNGPFEDVDPDQTTTVYASAATGAITLTASTPIFTADMVDTLFLLEQKKVDGYAVWEVGKVIALGAERRSDSNVYRALNAATTGSVKPTHREGAKFDGDAGVQWLYVHSGYGIARITSVAGLTANATVISEIPSQAVGVANASTKWAKAAWRSAALGGPGYPTLGTIFRERLVIARGQQLWGSVAGDFENFAARDGAETLPDSAFSITIGSSETNAAVWMVAKDALLVGTRGAEFSVGQMTESEVFGPGNIKAAEESKYGARQVPPAVIGDSVLFAQRSGRRMRDVRFSFNTASYEATDLMVLSGHIANGQIIQCDFALEPHSEMWACCNNGDVIALTYQLEQDVLGWHPHRIGGGSGEKGMGESVVVIPSPDGTHDQVWMQVYRVIDGTPTRFIEYMERDWDATQELETALYSDSGSTFNGFIPGATATINGFGPWSAGAQATVTVTGMTLVVGDQMDYLVLVGADGLEARIRLDTVTSGTTADVTFVTAIPPSLQNVASTNVSFARDVIGGLGYLEGEEVTLTVEGAAHPRRIVTGGQITLQNPARLVQVGLPADAELVTMRLEGGSANGTAQGKKKRIHQVAFRLHETLGGAAGPEGGEDPFQFRSDFMPMNEPPPVFTGDYHQMYNEGYNSDARIRVICDQPLPFSLIAIYPQLMVEDRT